MRITHRLLTATAGLASAALLLAGCSGTGSDPAPETGASTTEAPETTATTEATGETPAAPQDEPVFNLESGDCVADIEAVFGGAEQVDNVENVGVIDCAEPHTGEVFHVESLPEGEIPAMEELAATAEQTCLDQFEPFVGAPYLQSDLEIAYFHPTPKSWDYGDRDILCVITSAEPTQGSASQSAA